MGVEIFPGRFKHMDQDNVGPRSMVETYGWASREISERDGMSPNASVQKRGFQ